MFTKNPATRIKTALAYCMFLFPLVISACKPEDRSPPASVLVVTDSPTALSSPAIVRDNLQPEVAASVHPEWRSLTNANDVSNIVFDSNGNLWTSGRGGVVKWDTAEGTYTKFTAEHGLGGNYITALAAGPDGVLWAGTHNGILSQFGGQTWELMNIDVGQVIRSIASTDDGAAWIGTNEGVHYFDGSNLRTYMVEDGLVDNYIQSIAIDADGIVWAGSTGGVSYFDGTKWMTREFPVGTTVFSIAVGPDDIVWFGLSNGLLASFDGVQWSTYEIRNELGEIYQSPISSITINAKGEIFFSNKHQIFRYDHQSLHPIIRPQDNPILNISAGPNNALWYGQFYGGVSRIYGDQKSTTTFRTEDKLVTNFVTAVSVNQEGSVWIGTNEGVSLFNRDSWQNFSKNDGLITDSVLSIAAGDDGTVWIGTERGLSVFDGNRWIAHDSQSGLPGNRVHAIALDQDQIVWVGTNRGLAKFDGSSWNIDTTFNSFVLDEVTCIAPGVNNTLWVVTPDEIAFFDGLGWQSIDAPIRGISSCD